MREHDDDQGQILPHPRSCSVPTKRRTDRPGPDPHHWWISAGAPFGENQHNGRATRPGSAGGDVRAI